MVLYSVIRLFKRSLTSSCIIICPRPVRQLFTVNNLPLSQACKASFVEREADLLLGDPTKLNREGLRNSSRGAILPHIGICYCTSGTPVSKTYLGLTLYYI
jgi:hypothetical protein